MMVNDWHDGFEPNTQTKQNRGSIWVYTLIFLSPPDIKNQSCHSFHIAIGPKGANHKHIVAGIRTPNKSPRKVNPYLSFPIG